MNYLIYIEHAAENLQFFLWYRDYVKRFMALPENQRALAPGVHSEKLEVEPKGPRATKLYSAAAAAAFKGTDFALSQTNAAEPPQNPFFDPPRPSTGTEDRPFSAEGSRGWDDDSSTLQSSRKTDHHAVAAKAYASADVKIQPCRSWNKISASLDHVLTVLSHGPTI